MSDREEDLVEREVRLVEEESKSYPDAVSLTLHENDHVKRSLDSMRKCASAHELMALVQRLPMSRCSSSRSLTANRIIKTVNSEEQSPIKSLRESALLCLGMEPTEKIPLTSELEKLGAADRVLIALGDTSSDRALPKMREAAVEGFKPVTCLLIPTFGVQIHLYLYIVASALRLHAAQGEIEKLLLQPPPLRVHGLNDTGSSM